MDSQARRSPPYGRQTIPLQSVHLPKPPPSAFPHVSLSKKRSLNPQHSTPGGLDPGRNSRRKTSRSRIPGWLRLAASAGLFNNSAAWPHQLSMSQVAPQDLCLACSPGCGKECAQESARDFHGKVYPKLPSTGPWALETTGLAAGLNPTVPEANPRSSCNTPRGDLSHVTNVSQPHHTLSSGCRYRRLLQTQRPRHREVERLL